jgi:NTE family protein
MSAGSMPTAATPVPAIPIPAIPMPAFHRPAPQPPHHAPPPAPRLALVIGSGGVRGVAALGIVDVLAREGIHPELVVGCSSGALFGASIAMRMGSQDALAVFTRVWTRELTQQRRWRAYAEMLAPRLAGFGTGFAMRHSRPLAQVLSRELGDRCIEDLPTPLRVAATHAGSGEPVVLTRGPLVAALRASMAVPFLFPSVEIDGQHLVDGVLSDPLPIAAASDAHVVIALGLEGEMPRRVDRMSRLVAQTSTTLINNLQQARIDAARAGGQRLLCIDLALERRVGLWETGAMPHVFEAGQRAARARLAQIVEMLDPPSRQRLT